MDGRWRESLKRVLKNNLIDEYVVTITPHILGFWSAVISRQESRNPFNFNGYETFWAICKFIL